MENRKDVGCNAQFRTLMEIQSPYASIDRSIDFREAQQQIVFQSFLPRVEDFHSSRYGCCERRIFRNYRMQFWIDKDDARKKSHFFSYVESERCIGKLTNIDDGDHDDHKLKLRHGRDQGNSLEQVLARNVSGTVTVSVFFF